MVESLATMGHEGQGRNGLFYAVSGGSASFEGDSMDFFGTTCQIERPSLKGPPVDTPTEIPTETPSIFSTWGLSDDLLRALEKMSYTKPTPVQEAVIPFLLETGGDAVVLAKTGTGKTAAFGIPLTQKLVAEPVIQALVLCPTRELAAQVARTLTDLGRFKGLHVTSILGGESYRRQIDSLSRGPQIVVSTPGRLVDLLDRDLLDLSRVKELVLDEADEMLSFGFQDAMAAIRERITSPEVATWLFSATMSPGVQNLSRRILKDPRRFSLVEAAEPLKIKAYAAVVFEEDKEKALSLLLQQEPGFYGIIFAQTKKQVSDLEYRLGSLGMAVESLHGDKAQAERHKVLDRLRRREARILVATDVAARGLDIADLTHVVNFELPWDVETYTHRIGRTARAGKTGVVWTFVKPKEAPNLRKFERALNFKFENLKIPTSRDVLKSRVRTELEKMLKLEVDDAHREFFGQAVADFARENGIEVSAETESWVMKSLRSQGLRLSPPTAEPRSFELRTDASPRASVPGRAPREGFAPRGPRDGYAPRGARGEGGFRREGAPPPRAGGARFRDQGERFERYDRRDDRSGDQGPRREGGFAPRRDDRFERRDDRRSFGEGDRPAAAPERRGFADGGSFKRKGFGAGAAPRKKFGPPSGGDRPYRKPTRD